MYTIHTTNNNQILPKNKFRFMIYFSIEYINFISNINYFVCLDFVPRKLMCLHNTFNIDIPKNNDNRYEIT